jgi:hypothetical protein
MNEDKSEKTPERSRDEEVDTTTAIDIARRLIKKVFGNLNMLQFKLEGVRKNGSETVYLVTLSIIPDVGEEREYYLIRVDVKSGNVLTPVGKGKKQEDGSIEYYVEEIKIPKELSE